MDFIENTREVARELLLMAQCRGVDLKPYCSQGHFQNDQRWIYLWRKDNCSASGTANEPDGTLHYNMEGAITVLPEKLSGSANAFRGDWSEAGTFDTLEQAFDLLNAWLLEKKEVDELPQRHIRRYQI